MRTLVPWEPVLVEVSRWYRRDGLIQEPCHHRAADAPLAGHGSCMPLQKLKRWCVCNVDTPALAQTAAGRVLAWYSTTLP
jgi:hypothetical protein